MKKSILLVLLTLSMSFSAFADENLGPEPRFPNPIQNQELMTNAGSNYGKQMIESTQHNATVVFETFKTIRKADLTIDMAISYIVNNDKMETVFVRVQQNEQSQIVVAPISEQLFWK